MSIYNTPEKAVDEVCRKKVSGSNPHRAEVVDLLRRDVSESRRSPKIPFEELDYETAEALRILTNRVGASALSAGFRMRTVTAYGASGVTEAQGWLVIQGKESPEDEEWFENALPLDKLNAEQVAMAMEVCRAITMSQCTTQSSSPKSNGHMLKAVPNLGVKPYDGNPTQPHFIKR